jgi:DNA-binding transcriptional LysR family regulator
MVLTFRTMDERDLERARRRIRLRDLETLVAVVAAGGMRRAAAALHLSQPAVSKAMRELEDAVGVKLLERSRRGVVPTPLGIALVRRSRGLVDELQTALRELAWLAAPDSGEVRLGAMETLQAGLVAAAVQTQLQRHPRMHFFLESAQAAELIGHFLPQRLVDVVVARPLALPLPPDIDGEPLFSDQLRVVVGPEHPFARRRKLALAELRDEHWILSHNERMPGTPVPTAFAAAGVPFPERVVVTGSLNMRQTMLGRGRFVTCVPHSMLPFGQLREGLRILPIELPPWSTPTMILRLRGRSLAPAAETFLETLRDLARPLRIDSPAARD